MKSSVKIITLSFIKQFVFWILLFNVYRIIFLIYHIDLLRLNSVSFADILMVFFYSFRLDVSTACYIMLFPFILLAVQSFYNAKWLEKLNLFYTALIIVVYSLIAAGDIGIYREWQTKLSYKALLFLSHPREIYGSIPTWQFFLMVTALLLLCYGLFLLFRTIFSTSVNNTKKNYLFSALFFVFMPPLFLAGIRGGVQEIPINQSEAYFSEHQILNMAAVNSGWNLLYSISHNINNIDENPFAEFPPEYADNVVKNINKPVEDSTINILTTKRPNIVLFILEGWSADAVEALGGIKDATPFFSGLAEQGVLFTNFYSSGQRSQQGMASILGGFPSHPIDVVTHHQEKFSKLPSFNKELAANGYSSSFYFGGQLIYGNIKSYLLSCGFKHVVEGKDFPSSIPRGKLGVHDQFTLQKMFNDLSKEKQPFFSAIFTLSSHSPYDYPFPKRIKNFAVENDYMNGINYSDMCIGLFCKEAQKQEWYKNTLFVFISDHSHGAPQNRGIYSPEYHRIVFMLTGPAVKPEYRGMKVKHVGSQVDFAATLLPQLGIKADKFRWSKNLLNPCTSQYAFYAYEEGFGWVRPYGYSVYEHRLNRFHHFYVDSLHVSQKDSLTIEGKCYLQQVFQEYMDM